MAVEIKIPEKETKHHVYRDGSCVGLLTDPSKGKVSCASVFHSSASELRAIADKLDQLNGVE